MSKSAASPPANDEAARARALHMHHLQAIQKAEDIRKAAADEVKRLRKVAKGEGIILADIDFHLRVLKTEDDGIIPDEVKRRIRILEWAGMPIAFQGDLFAERRTAEEKAYQEGRADSAVGRTAKVPERYDPGSKAGQEYLRGHADDQAERREIMRADMEARKAKSGKGKATPLKGDTDQGAAAKSAKRAGGKPAEIKGLRKGGEKPDAKTAADPVTGAKPANVTSFSDAMRKQNDAVDKGLREQATGGKKADAVPGAGKSDKPLADQSPKGAA